MYQKGFTLVELLVVISIIGILAGIVLVSFAFVQDNARLANALSYAQQLHHRLLLNCTGEWTFENVSGSTAFDTCGTYDGTIDGATVGEGINKGLALHFDGVDDFVDLGAIDVTASGSGNDGLTIAAWFKADAWTNAPYRDGRIITKSFNHFDPGIYWMISTIAVSNNTRLRFRLKTAGVTSVLIADSGNLDLGKWYFATAVYDGSTMKLYLDGIEVGSMAKSGTVNVDPSSNAFLGNSSDFVRPWAGFIDDVRIYEEAVSAATIQKWYAEGAPTKILGQL